MYSRELQNKLLELSEHWSIISVTGPRQSGKTTHFLITNMSIWSVLLRGLLREVQYLQGFSRECVSLKRVFKCRRLYNKKYYFNFNSSHEASNDADEVTHGVCDLPLG